MSCLAGEISQLQQSRFDRYHWSSEKFLSLWRTKFSVLMARERGRIGADAALGDIPKRYYITSSTTGITGVADDVAVIEALSFRMMFINR